MKETIYAPIIIPTLCRYEHFKRCVDSLAKCTDADKTDLFIGLDYPAKESHWDGYLKIKEYVKSIAGFNKVTVIEHEKNQGSSANNLYLFNLVKKEYDRFIRADDDNEFSPNFLQYMNQCLTKFKDDPKVFGVCGWANPRVKKDVLSGYPYNAYPMTGYNPHGTGRWFSKIYSVMSKEELFYSYKNFFWAYTHSHTHLFHSILPLMKLKNPIGDLRKEFYCARNGLYCIFPVISKVRNWGFDGSGELCEVWGEANKAELDTNNTFVLDDFEIMDYPEVKRLERGIYGDSLRVRLYITIEYLWYRVTKKLFKESRIYKVLKKII